MCVRGDNNGKKTYDVTHVGSVTRIPNVNKATITRPAHVSGHFSALSELDINDAFSANSGRSITFIGLLTVFQYIAGGELFSA